MYTEVQIAWKSFCDSLRENAIKIIDFEIKTDFEIKKMKSLTKEQRNHMKIQKSVIFVNKNLKIKI